MTPDELKNTLFQLIALPLETEWLEFKEAKSGIDLDRIGRYFSAISNEANLKGIRFGWLIMGIQDIPRRIVGTNYKNTPASLDKLKMEIAQYTTNQLSFMDIYEILLPEGRVLMFQIPSAPAGMPVEWKGRLYGRVGECIGPLNQQEIDQIRNQPRRKDWSAEICPNANISVLDPVALIRARHEFQKKNLHLASEINHWDDITFLQKIRLSRKGELTHAAILLLGKPESDVLLNPVNAQISWVLRDEHGIERDYKHFGPPFITSSDAVYACIRNLTYRYIPDNTLFPIEVSKYDPFIIRETLHNCIAHQDYLLGGRITVVESPDQLLFSNPGSFIPGSLEAVIKSDAPPESYRNQLLVQAMISLNMIDAIGSGIKRMFDLQRRRFFPLPDYDLGESERVKVKIWGKIVDENYTRQLIQNSDLDLTTVISLDRVQKGLPLRVDEAKALKAQKLIEGRRPKYYVSAYVAALTGDKATYIRNRGFDDAHYKKMIVELIAEFGMASRDDINNLLLDKLSEVLTFEQKKRKIGNLLQSISKKDGLIENVGSAKKSKWVLKQ